MHATSITLRRRRIGLLVAGVVATLAQAHAETAAPAPATLDNLPLQTVTVNGERERDGCGARGALGERSDLDTPFATASVGSARIEDRQIASLAQVFADDASVNAQGGTYTQGDGTVDLGLPSLTRRGCGGPEGEVELAMLAVVGGVVDLGADVAQLLDRPDEGDHDLGPCVPAPLVDEGRGLEDGRNRTLEDVGRQVGVTRERIRQIEAKALRKLRHPSRAKMLRDYLEE